MDLIAFSTMEIGLARIRSRAVLFRNEKGSKKAVQGNNGGQV